MGGYGNGKGQQWDGYCGFSKQYTDEKNGKCNHMMCPFWVNNYLCRDLHEGLEAHSGPGGVTATEDQYQAVKKKCQETWPAWTASDTPPIPMKAKWGRRGGSRGKGSGKGEGKGS